MVVSSFPGSLNCPDDGAEIDMTASISAPTVVRALLLTPELDVADDELEEELDVAEAEVLPGLAESPVIPPPQWGYES